MFDVGAGSPLLERDTEIAFVQLMLGRLESGTGGSMLVLGDAGVGKSALLATVARSAHQQGAQVFWTTGVQSEVTLPFAALQQLLRPLDHHIQALRPAQAASLRTAIGQGDGPAADLYAVALAVLELLAEAAAAQPLALLIDDVQWVDEATDRVLAFVARRLVNEPIVLVAAMREGYGGVVNEVGLPVLRLFPLSAGASEELLRAGRPDLDARERRELREVAQGNPLALIELPLSTSNGFPPTAEAALRLTTRLKRSFAARFREFDSPTRLAVLVAAADDDADLHEVLAALQLTVPGSGGTVASLYPAIDAGLLWIEGRRVRFRHPLVRSAVYQSATASERHDVHVALAGVLTNKPERRAWQLAAAGSGPDESVAVELDRAARDAQRRGASAVSASTWERAAWFSVDAPRKSFRLLQAAELWAGVGELNTAADLLVRVEPLLGELLDLARAALIHEMVTAAAPGDPDRVRALCELAIRAAGETGGVDLAARLLLTAAQRVWAVDLGDASRAAVVTAANRLPIDADDPRRLSIVGYADPRGHESVITERVLRMTAADLNDSGAELVMSVYLIGDQRLAGLQRAVIDEVRAHGRLVELPRLLTLQAWTAIAAADWQVALTGLTEAMELAEETRQPLWLAAAMTGRAMVDALRGELAGADRHLSRVEALMLPQRATPVLCGVQLVRGITAIAAGRYDAAYPQLRRLFDVGDAAHHPVQSLWALGDLVEAGAHSGNLEDARHIVARVLPPDGPAVSPWTRAARHYIRPFLATPDLVEQEFRAALDSELTRWPWYHARLTLHYGQWLRHHHRGNDSRVPLRAAREVCDAYGLVRWAERARQELRAAGEVSATTRPAVWATLSPQELQIARLAAEGMSNREIGQRLFLSHRTVGSHLYRLFPKLGVTSRAQLRRALEMDRDLLR